jgi:IS5 family transposase
MISVFFVFPFFDGLYRSTVVQGACFAKVRYRGLAKNANRAFAMLALVNLVKWGRPLTGEVRPK